MNYVVIFAINVKKKDYVDFYFYKIFNQMNNAEYCFNCSNVYHGIFNQQLGRICTFVID